MKMADWFGAKGRRVQRMGRDLERAVGRGDLAEVRRIMDEFPAHQVARCGVALARALKDGHEAAARAIAAEYPDLAEGFGAPGAVEHVFVDALRRGSVAMLTALPTFGTIRVETAMIHIGGVWACGDQVAGRVLRIAAGGAEHGDHIAALVARVMRSAKYYSAGNYGFRPRLLDPYMSLGTYKCYMECVVEDCVLMPVDVLRSALEYEPPCIDTMGVFISYRNAACRKISDVALARDDAQRYAACVAMIGPSTARACCFGAPKCARWIRAQVRAAAPGWEPPWRPDGASGELSGHWQPLIAAFAQPDVRKINTILRLLDEHWFGDNCGEVIRLIELPPVGYVGDNVNVKIARIMIADPRCTVYDLAALLSDSIDGFLRRYDVRKVRHGGEAMDRYVEYAFGGVDAPVTNTPLTTKQISLMRQAVVSGRLRVRRVSPGAVTNILTRYCFIHSNPTWANVNLEGASDGDVQSVFDVCDLMYAMAPDAAPAGELVESQGTMGFFLRVWMRDDPTIVPIKRLFEARGFSRIHYSDIAAVPCNCRSRLLSTGVPRQYGGVWTCCGRYVKLRPRGGLWGRIAVADLVRAAARGDCLTLAEATHPGRAALCRSAWAPLVAACASGALVGVHYMLQIATIEDLQETSAPLRAALASGRRVVEPFLDKGITAGDLRAAGVAGGAEFTRAVRRGKDAVLEHLIRYANPTEASRVLAACLAGSPPFETPACDPACVREPAPADESGVECVYCLEQVDDKSLSKCSRCTAGVHAACRVEATVNGRDDICPVCRAPYA